MEYGWETSTIADKNNLFGLMNDFYGYITSNNSLSFTAEEIVFWVME